MKIAPHKQAFGAVAKEYKKWRGGYDTRLYDLLLSLPGKKPGLAILDVGCGVGNSTEPVFELAKKRKIPVDIVGVEPDSRMLVVARKSAKKNKLPITYIEAHAEKMPLTSETFDLAYSCAAFHWFATKKALNSIHRVLKPGAPYAAVWTLFAPSNDPVIGAELYKKYKSQGIPKALRDPKNIKKIFESGGFKKVKILKIPYVKKHTIESVVGSLKTNSTYALLSLTDRKEFADGMRKAYKAALNGKNLVTENRELVVVHGIK